MEEKIKQYIYELEGTKELTQYLYLNIDDMLDDIKDESDIESVVQRCVDNFENEYDECIEWMKKKLDKNE